jgi:chitin synthase
MIGGHGSCMDLQELEQEKKDAEEAKKKAKQKSLLGFLNGGGGGNDSEEGSIEFSLAGLFKVMFCTHPKSVDEKQQLLRIAESLDSLGRRLETIERFVSPPNMSRVNRLKSINYL